MKPGCKESFNIISDVLNSPVENIYSRERKRLSHRESQQYEKQNSTYQFFTVKENDLKFLVNLTDYLDTGLFLIIALQEQWFGLNQAIKEF
jgi:23S rRNA (cytosine1962-C5)-methyltransferase